LQIQTTLKIIFNLKTKKVGKVADKMLDDPKGVEKNYLPPLAEVLFSTPLINSGQTYKFTFKAPRVPGDYPFICTFPGHWQLMVGVMRVR
jgi:uncharacterized protein